MPHRRVILGAMENQWVPGLKESKLFFPVVSMVPKLAVGRNFPREPFLSTIKSHIDYFEQPCLTRSGYIGIKVYLCLA